MMEYDIVSTSVLRLSWFSSTELQYWRVADWLDQRGKFYRKLHQLVYCSLPFSTQCWDIDSIYWDNTLGNVEISLEPRTESNLGERKTPERIIPIQFDTRISAVKKALQQTVQHVETEMTAEEVQQDLLKENIAPMEIEKEEDAVKAASAEVVEGEKQLLKLFKKGQMYYVS